MPAARLSARTATGRAGLLAILTAAAITFISLAPTQTVFACPPPPMPLRALYMGSDLIVVARISETTPVELVSSGEGDSYKRYLMRTSLKVASTVKGQGNYGVVNLYHWGWQQQNKEYSHSLSRFPKGEKLLFFLNPRDNGEGYELVDYSYGVKNLSEADLKVYLQRIDELALIMQQEKPDPAQIVEWLVRCAEETATRWEGLEELSMSNYALLASSRNNETAKETTEAEVASESESGEKAQADDDSSAVDNSGEVADETKVEEFVNPIIVRRSLYLAPDPNFMRLLTESQKSRLTNVLFNSKTITYEEIPLLELAKQWNDPRLVPFVMSQLRSFVDDAPTVAEPLVRFMAETLDDKEAVKLMEKYCYESCYNDEEEVDVSSEEVESGDEVESAAEADEAGTEPQEAEAKQEAEAEAKSDETEEPVVGNCTQKRSIRLKRFIARAESVIAR